jgi:hypothetical protein
MGVLFRGDVGRHIQQNGNAIDFIETDENGPEGHLSSPLLVYRPCPHGPR